MSINWCTDKMWHVRAMECYSAIKRTEGLTQATTQMNLGNMMLGERNQTQKATYYVVPLT